MIAQGTIIKEAVVGVPSFTGAGGVSTAGYGVHGIGRTGKYC